MAGGSFRQAPQIGTPPGTTKAQRVQRWLGCANRATHALHTRCAGQAWHTEHWLGTRCASWVMGLKRPDKRLKSMESIYSPAV